MKEIEARLRAEAPAWRDAVARGAEGVGTEAPTPGGSRAHEAWRRGAGLALAAGIAGVALVVGLWPEREAAPRDGQTVRVVVPAIPEISALDEPYRVEMERVTEDVRRAVDFVVSVLPAELVAAPARDEAAL